MNQTVEVLADAKKAADRANIKGILKGSCEISRCVDCFKQLESCPFNIQLIDTHNIFKKLEYLSKHKRRKICSAASRVIDVWKKRILTKDSCPAPRNSCSTHRHIIRIKLLPKVPAEPSSKTVSKLSSGAPPQRSSLKTEHSDDSSTKGTTICLKIPLETPHRPASQNVKDASRGKIRTMLEEALSKVASEIGEKVHVSIRDYIKVAAEVEYEMFRKLGPCVGNQKLKYRSILFNLRDPKNPDLRRRVVCGEIKPADLLNVKSEELANNQIKFEISQIKEKAGLREQALLQ
ncbi:transcription elongation factor TFIIS-like [Carica papaya]|uniref:transcription elongation factor TFIIS-like n=1 Tax=Carica papaya TaxID=3649 RepID=UPI000B8CA21B|nr:transcription elongation factor TFIIS-like [Carica papaya]